MPGALLFFAFVLLKEVSLTCSPVRVALMMLTCKYECAYAQAGIAIAIKDPA